MKERMCAALLRENTPSNLEQTFLTTLFESAERCRFTDTADATLSTAEDLRSSASHEDHLYYFTKNLSASIFEAVCSKSNQVSVY